MRVRGGGDPAQARKTAACGSRRTRPPPPPLLTHRFDLGSILTRAHSLWHKAEPLPGTLSEAEEEAEAAYESDYTDAEGTGGSFDEAGRDEGYYAAPKSGATAGGRGSPLHVPAPGGWRAPILCSKAGLQCAGIRSISPPPPPPPPLPPPGGAVVDQHGTMTDGAGVPTGTPLPDPPLIEAISKDPVLARTKLIAEAWDCDGLNQVWGGDGGGGGGARLHACWGRCVLLPAASYQPPPPPPHNHQVGAFPHYGRWSEWNGHFRDAVRQFVKGTEGPWVGNMASALCGSPNIFIAEPGENDWCGAAPGGGRVGGREGVEGVCAGRPASPSTAPCARRRHPAQVGPERRAAVEGRPRPHCKHQLCHCARRLHAGRSG